ncbi:hypothetical protein GCM10022221_43660 [Actinocorallia aurea]
MQSRKWCGAGWYSGVDQSGMVMAVGDDTGSGSKIEMDSILISGSLGHGSSPRQEVSSQVIVHMAAP